MIEQAKSFNELIIERNYKTTGNCRIMLAKNEFFKVSVGFILPKKSPLKPIIDQKYSLAWDKIILFKKELSKTKFEPIYISLDCYKW